MNIDKEVIIAKKLPNIPLHFKHANQQEDLYEDDLLKEVDATKILMNANKSRLILGKFARIEKIIDDYKGGNNHPLYDIIRREYPGFLLENYQKVRLYLDKVKNKW